jgi:hypothetical protein
MNNALTRVLAGLTFAVIVCMGTIRLDAQSLVPLYHYRYGANLNWFYTANYNELGGGGGGWLYYGVSMQLYDAQATGTVPLYRFFSPTYGKHFYTTNYNEVGAPDWQYEGVTGFIFPQQESGTVPIRRWLKWNDGPVHYYTVSTAFDSDLIQGGFVFEGVTGYAVAP